MRKPIRGVLGGGVGALVGLAVGGLGLTAVTLIGSGIGAAVGAKRPDC